MLASDTPWGTEHDIAVDERGTATVVWVEFDPEISAYLVRMATVDADGNWSDTKDLSGPEDNAARSPRVAVSARGRATVVWVARGAQQVRARSRSVTGEWDTAMTLHDGGTVRDPRVAVDNSGNTTVVWEHSERAVDRVRARHQVGLGWDVADEELGLGTDPEVVLDRQGNATVVWLGRRLSSPAIMTRRTVRGRGRPWSAASTIADGYANGTVSTPWVAVDSRGDVTAIWARSELDTLDAEAAHRTSRGDDWVSAGTLAVRSASAIPAAGLDPRGHATLVWSASSILMGPWFGDSRVLDPITPELRRLAVPDRASVGQPVDFSVAPFDISPVTTTWNFGDGSTASGASAVHRFATAGDHTITVTGTDTAGNVAHETRTITIVPSDVKGPSPHPDPVPAPTPNPIPAVTAPTLSGLRQSASRWSTRKFRGSKLPVGTKFRYRLNRSAQVRLSFAQILDGRRAGKRCSKPTKKNRRQRACRRYEQRGTANVAGKAGTNHVTFRGKVGGRTLKPGHYRVIVSANADGTTSESASKTFTIVR